MERGREAIFDINGWEFIILLVVGIVVLGPERLPEYAAKLARLVRQVKGMAHNAREQLKEQMGPDFEDVDWTKYDPRQYDPRRIVLEALMNDGTLREALMDDGTLEDQLEKPQSGLMTVPADARG